VVGLAVYSSYIGGCLHSSTVIMALYVSWPFLTHGAGPVRFQYLPMAGGRQDPTKIVAVVVAIIAALAYLIVASPPAGHKLPGLDRGWKRSRDACPTPRG